MKGPRKKSFSAEIEILYFEDDVITTSGGPSCYCYGSDGCGGDAFNSGGCISVYMGCMTDGSLPEGDERGKTG